EERLARFYCTMIDRFVQEKTIPGAVKPNLAFYEQYGFEGLRALKKIILKAKEYGIPVILDAKRGDIGKTSKAYAKAFFEFWDCDCLTVAPYMGSDSVGPFLEYSTNGKGVYILCRTSNKGAVDLQDIKTDDGEPFYIQTARKIIEWHKEGTGAVVGATYPEELGEIAKLFVKSEKQVPLLIPGVGAQGGSAREVVGVLKKAGYDMRICRINSSSGINFAYLKTGSEDFAGEAVKALKELNDEIGKIIKQ
ncbi:orotidine-5'-phosphate decarboxylase, partial [Candidatus Woesearchaeota archaeon]|nr:orotidine-5'-phosphate decarboxylase [Candidatus Woesearchaeota archaeon]